MQFIAILSNALSSLGSTFAERSSLLLIVVFLAVFALVYAGSQFLRPRKSFGDRLSSARQPGGDKAPSLRRGEPDTLLHSTVKKLDERLVKTNEEERSAIARRLVQAGYDGETAVRLYYLARILLAIMLPVIFLLLVPTLAPAMPLKKMLFIAMGLCIAGLYIPYRFVDSKVTARQQAVREGFPDALDMLVVCVQAGLGLDAAFIRVGGQIERAHPVLAEQFGVMALELRAGKSREEALRNFADRNAVQDITTFVTLLIQSEALGADLSQTLKVQADEMRTTRMLRAEETAAKLPVKLSIPLVSCILPTLFAVVLGPAMIDIIRNVLPHLAHR